MVYNLNTCKFDLIVSIKMHLYSGQDIISFETLHYWYIYTTCLIFMKFTQMTKEDIWIMSTKLQVNQSNLDVIYHNIYHFQDLLLISILIGLGQSL